MAGKLTTIGQYRYDSLGRRIFKEAKLEEQIEQRHFVWQGLRLLYETTPETSRLYLYEPGSYAPLARVDKVEGIKSEVYYFHTDQIGTPVELTDADGEIVWQANYRAWGEVENLIVDQVEQALRFQGQYCDSETGLHYNTFRYYDPGAGRFVTQDPLGLKGGDNLFEYAANPVEFIDPLGLCANKDWKAYYTRISGTHAPEGMIRPHAHHIVLKETLLIFQGCKKHLSAVGQYWRSIKLILCMISRRLCGLLTKVIQWQMRN